MSNKTSIEWTEQTWNPAVGCSKVSPGCAHCYAEVMARRLKAMRVKGYENGFRLTLLPRRLEEPVRRKQPTVYFVNSMSDLFHRRCDEQGVDFFFKQWGGWGPDGKKRSKKHNGRMLEGRIWNAAPRPTASV